MALAEPKDNDSIKEVDGIKIIYDYMVGKYAKTIGISCKDTAFGRKLVIKRLM